jgi:NhaA family Na+:H+ antiporter
MKTLSRSHGIREIRAEASPVSKKVALPAEKYIESETISGMVLLIMTALALAWANSPSSGSYFALLHTPIHVSIGSFAIREDLKHWINDGLMAIFFFVIALEVKRELLFGELAGWKKAALPVIAAVGGMVVPVAVFFAFTAGTPAMRGWGIPMATDIAFAVAVLALLGDRLPNALRVFLLAYAIVDDIGSILVIAIFYTGELSWPALGTAAALLAVILAMRFLGIRTTALYIVPALVFWAAMLKSGVHATIAGVLLGAITPARSDLRPHTFVKSADETLPKIRDALDKPDDEAREVFMGRIEELVRQTESPLERLERIVHPWVSFLILPMFALANAGVAISVETIRTALESPLTYGVLLGLLLGKPLGTCVFSLLAVKFGMATLPDQVHSRQLIGAGILGGVGFTVALFITELALDESTQADQAKLAVLSASAIAAIAGYPFLKMFALERREETRGGMAHAKSRCPEK